VIVIGLDGLDPRVAESMLSRGELPHLATLRASGGFSRVATTTPAQTPVAWSTFATGVNPGGHGIFDFLRRDPGTYRLDVALNRYEQPNAFSAPKAVNLRKGTTVWERLSAAGVSSSIVRCPCTYPPGPLEGRLLSGMGVPDLRGGFGTSTYYTSADNAGHGESEQTVRVAPDADGSIATHLIGPMQGRDRAGLRLDVTIQLNREAGTAVLRSSGVPAELPLREGQWSSWLRVKFKAGMLQTIRGMVRFYLIRVGPVFELYATPIQFDPEQPMFPISTPRGFAEELAEELGPYATAGMIEDHAGLSNGRFGEEAFLAQADDIWRERAGMMLHELDRFEEGLFFCLFDTPDRVQHMFWRFRDPSHPANFGQEPSPDLAQAVEDQYRRADDVVGMALNYTDDETLLIAMSDHGFCGFRRGVDLNRWLFENGYLALKPGVETTDPTRDQLQDVDWDRTRAYAMGLGGIYLNLRGREANGTVAEADAAATRREIAGRLTGLRDPADGGVAVRGVGDRNDLYRGPMTGDAPDLFANFSEGYRASWASTLGGMDPSLFQDNTKKWGGDHVVDPSLVPGSLFLNRPYRGEGARLVDLAPTILEALGVPGGPELEGRSLLP
jgi:predicted AlkP superfamily phosphohydrolase/phosphomutase